MCLFFLSKMRWFIVPVSQSERKLHSHTSKHNFFFAITDSTHFSCSVNTSIKHSPVPAKLSQKQRKILAMASKEASVESTNVSKTTPTVTPSKSSGKAWWVSSIMGLKPAIGMTSSALSHQRLPIWLHGMTNPNPQSKCSSAEGLNVFYLFIFTISLPANFHSLWWAQKIK